MVSVWIKKDFCLGRCMLISCWHTTNDGFLTQYTNNWSVILFCFLLFTCDAPYRQRRTGLLLWYSFNYVVASFIFYPVNWFYAFPNFFCVGCFLSFFFIFVSPYFCFFFLFILHKIILLCRCFFISIYEIRQLKDSFLTLSTL